jgi:hypothetical protein
LQSQYYLELSSQITETLAKTGQPVSCLTDPAFVDLFEKVCQEHKIIEYYLIDNHGSFMMLDKNSKATFLVIKDEAEMQNLTEFAEYEHAPQDVIDALKSREKMPFFFEEEDFDMPPKEWGGLMNKAALLNGLKQYYYVVTNQGNFKRHGIDKRNIE